MCKRLRAVKATLSAVAVQPQLGAFKQVAPLLDGVRVLDLATARAEITGRLLADLGAEVLKIEPPGGAAARNAFFRKARIAA